LEPLERLEQILFASGITYSAKVERGNKKNSHRNVSWPSKPTADSGDGTPHYKFPFFGLLTIGTIETERSGGTFGTASANGRPRPCLGQVAGAYYGELGIPAKWLNRLAMRQEITMLADRLLEANKAA
jgi:hypothetical protein